MKSLDENVVDMLQDDKSDPMAVQTQYSSHHHNQFHMLNGSRSDTDRLGISELEFGSQAGEIFIPPRLLSGQVSRQKASFASQSGSHKALNQQFSTQTGIPDGMNTQQ